MQNGWRTSGRSKARTTKGTKVHEGNHNRRRQLACLMRVRLLGQAPRRLSHEALSVHSAYIIRQCQHKFAATGRDRAGERSAAQNFHRSAVGESQMVIGILKRADVGLEFFVSA